MFSQTNRGKIKNATILSWRLELSQLHHDIRHKPGVYNVARQRNLLTPARRQTVCRSCRTCAEIKPRFFKPPVQSLKGFTTVGPSKSR